MLEDPEIILQALRSQRDWLEIIIGSDAPMFAAKRSEWLIQLARTNAEISRRCVPSQCECGGPPCADGYLCAPALRFGGRKCSISLGRV